MFCVLIKARNDCTSHLIEIGHKDALITQLSWRRAARFGRMELSSSVLLPAPCCCSLGCQYRLWLPIFNLPLRSMANWSVSIRGQIHKYENGFISRAIRTERDWIGLDWTGTWTWTWELPFISLKLKLKFQHSLLAIRDHILRAKANTITTTTKATQLSGRLTMGKALQLYLTNARISRKLLLPKWAAAAAARAAETTVAQTNWPSHSFINAVECVAVARKKVAAKSHTSNNGCCCYCRCSGDHSVSQPAIVVGNRTNWVPPCLDLPPSSLEDDDDDAGYFIIIWNVRRVVMGWHFWVAVVVYGWPNGSKKGSNINNIQQQQQTHQEHTITNKNGSEASQWLIDFQNCWNF